MAIVETWVGVALVAAGTQAVYETLQKRLTAEVDTLRLSYVTSLLGTVLLAPVAVWIAGTSPLAITPVVAGGVLVGVGTNVLALYAFLTALDRADLSVVSPLRQSTPLWVAVIEPLLLGAGGGLHVLAGAAAATLGGYVLLADGGIRSPLSRMSEFGPLLALGTAGLYAVASVAARFVVVRIPPLAFTFLLYLGMTAGFGVLLARRDPRQLRENVLGRRFLAVGIATTARSVFIFAAFALTTAAEVTVVLRVSLLVTVVAGGLLFGEEGIARRLVGTGIIVAGVWMVL